MFAGVRFFHLSTFIVMHMSRKPIGGSIITRKKS